MTSISDQTAARGGDIAATEDRTPGRHDDAQIDAATQELHLTAGEVGGLAGVVMVAAIATWSLALAQLGQHDGWLAVGLGLLTTRASPRLVVAIGRRPRIRVDVVELGLLAAVALAGAFFFLPGFHYAYGDKDPGVYVAHGFAIARDGDVYIDDPVLERGLIPDFDQAGRFPGIWTDADHPNQVTSQFYHLYSALLATADDIGGPRCAVQPEPPAGRRCRAAS